MTVPRPDMIGASGATLDSKRMGVHLILTAARSGRKQASVIIAGGADGGEYRQPMTGHLNVRSILRLQCDAPIWLSNPEGYERGWNVRLLCPFGRNRQEWGRRWRRGEWL